MNLLGKALTIAVFVLSIVFMVVAIAVNASHRNWRDVVLGPGGLKQQIETVETTNKQLRDTAQRAQAALAREQAARRTSLAALQSQLSDALSELNDLSTSVAELRALNNELGQQNAANGRLLEAKSAEVTRLRSTLRKEQEDRDALFAKALKLTDELSQSKGLLQNQKQRNDQLMAQLTRLQEVTESMGINVDDPIDGAPPERNGNVLVVNRQRKQVEVSIGSDDGLRDGHLLDVTRDGTYVTRLKVIFTEPDRAAAEILTDYNNRTIQEGDRVDTTFE